VKAKIEAKKLLGCVVGFHSFGAKHQTFSAKVSCLAPKPWNPTTPRPRASVTRVRFRGFVSKTSKPSTGKVRFRGFVLETSKPNHAIPKGSQSDHNRDPPWETRFLHGSVQDPVGFHSFETAPRDFCQWMGEEGPAEGGKGEVNLPPWKGLNTPT